MEKEIASFTARRQFGQLLDDVMANGDRFVVERNGKPVAAVVPIALYEQWKRSREAFFERWRQAAERANVSPEEADALAKEAVSAVRHQDHA
jgi:prevent-host-death family protein